ncbi:MAG: type II toxin-antitoxin system HicB family antitoxin [Trueperaceae bacterium]
MDQRFAVRMHVEQVENGQFLATSADLPGLVAQGRTVEEALEIAADVARRLLDSYREHGDPVPSQLRALGREFEVEVPVTAPWAGSLG